MTDPLTVNEQQWFTSLTRNLGNLSLLRTYMRGEPVAVIVDTKEGRMGPVAVLVNEAVLALLDPPPCPGCGEPMDNHTHE